MERACEPPGTYSTGPILMSSLSPMPWTLMDNNWLIPGFRAWGEGGQWSHGLLLSLSSSAFPPDAAINPLLSGCMKAWIPASESKRWLVHGSESICMHYVTTYIMLVQVGIVLCGISENLVLGTLIFRQTSSFHLWAKNEQTKRQCLYVRACTLP